MKVRSHSLSHSETLEAHMITSKKIRLRKKILADATNNYAWQTDPELVQLDAAPLLTTTFSQYLAAYLEELLYTSSRRYTFAIETLDGKHIGNCSYYDINETNSEAQLGIKIGNHDYWDKGYGTETVATLLNYIFQETNLNRIYLKTLALNTRAQRCFQKCGFVPRGHLNRDGYHFVIMEIHRKQWEERQTKS
jgi:RimJ/RimL family protein N-acetyltransferase